MQVINTNVSSLNAQRALSSTQEAQRTAMERLSSGVRINRAKDDSAGLAISNSMTSQITGLNQGIRNTSDGISMVQVAEGALVEVSDMLQRIRELKVQYTNETNNSTQRGYLDEEFSQLADEIGGVIELTKFNGFQVLSGGLTSTGTGSFTIQKGWASGDTITVGVSSLQGNAAMVSAIGSITTQTGDASKTSLASTTITKLDAALDAVNDARVKLGSQQNRMESSVNSAKNMADNISASRSRIVDADFAAESAELSRTNVLQQAVMAMLSQANQSPQQVLSLLR